MNTLILGGDKRYYEIIEAFKNKKYNIDLVGYKNKIDKTNNLNISDVDVSKYDIILFPVNAIGEDYTINGEINFKINPDFFKQAKDNVLIFSGIKTPKLDEILKNGQKKAFFLMKDKEVIKDNVIPTVEGILADIITNTDITIKNANILVIGYGNIGKYLVETLNHLKANTIVSIKEDYDKYLLDQKNIYNIFSNDIQKMNKVLEKTDIIINTVPSLVLDKNYIDNINNNAYILDVSSRPHGIDKEALIKKDINFKIYLGIPSKIAPKTSGLILSKKINHIIGG